MKEYLFIYLLQLSDVIQCTSLVLIGLSVVCIVLLLLLISTNWGCELEDYQKISIKVFTGLFILGLFLSFIPTKETLLLISGTHLGKKVITTERMSKVSKIIDYKLNDLIKEYKKEEQ